MDIHIIGYCVHCKVVVANTTDTVGWHVIKSLSGVTYVCPLCVSAMNLPQPYTKIKQKVGEFSEDFG